jgi:hypothetical protein
MPFGDQLREVLDYLENLAERFSGLTQVKLDMACVHVEAILEMLPDGL